MPTIDIFSFAIRAVIWKNLVRFTFTKNTMWNVLRMRLASLDKQLFLNRQRQFVITTMLRLDLKQFLT